jgi:penicillin-binding protein 1B
MALLAERRYSKNEILEAYLNEIYLGQNGLQGIFGIWEASQFYFARTPSELSLAETAMLAGLIRAPNNYSPYRDPTRARQRRNTVLGLLLEAGIVTQAEHDQAADEPLRVVGVRGGRNAAPYFVDYLRDELALSYPPEVLTSEGLRVFTTLDVQLQRYANAAVAEGLAELESRYPALKAKEPERAVQACLLAMQPQTGEIKAMVGGRNYGQSQFNRVIHALRQPGSVFKPFVYLAAFEQSATAEDPITPATILLDEPFEWRYDSRTWRPDNYRDRYLGRVTVRQALELSLNSATARLAHKVGLDPVRTLAHRMGISSELPPLPSIVLGAQEVSPFDIAQAYAVLANQGLRTVPRASKKVVDRTGQMIERHPVEMARVTSPQAAYLVVHILEGVLDQGTGREARQLGFNRPAAGKTGTTNEARDAWFVGFTPDLLAVVWVGFDESKRLGLTGSAAALPIWARFMKAATAGAPVVSFVRPPGVASVRIDPYTGGIATENCPDAIEEAFWKGQEPTELCPIHGGRRVSQADLH